MQGQRAMMANVRAYPATKIPWIAAFAAVALFPACGDDDGDDDGIGGVIDAAPTTDAAPTIDAARADAATADAAVTPDAMPASVTVVDCDAVTPAVTIDMVDIAFVPPTATISSGDVVMWTNSDAVLHTVTSGDPGDADAGAMFDSGNLAIGASYCLRFDGAGSFPYFCETHPVQMDDGLITVE